MTVVVENSSEGVNRARGNVGTGVGGESVCVALGSVAVGSV